MSHEGETSFGPFRLDSIEQTLEKGYTRVAITPKALAVLQYLVRHAGRFVPPKELHAAVWPNTHVSDGIIKVRVAELRRVLGDTANPPTFIETVSRRGYRFIAPVSIGNVPVSQNSLIGRERELAEIKRLLDRNRLVTLQGPAGVGKTRLASHVVSGLLGDMPHGVCWVGLAPLSDGSRVVQTVASLFGLRDGAGLSTMDTLIQALHARSLLLVLDNCEQVLEACATLTETLLSNCPNLKILATSREPLHVTGELAWSVPTLPVPDASVHPRDLLRYEAVRLFVDRAARACSSSDMSERDVIAVAEICRRLDGLPLAIELASARVKVLTPEQLATRLEDVFAVLGEEKRREPAHHRTLSAAFDWSYNLLTAKERLLFARLSVFPGSFTLEAVESVCSGTGLEPPAVLDLMARLVDHSLVKIVVSDPSPDQQRYRLLHTVRQYACKHLAPEANGDLLPRHAEFFLRVVETTEPHMYGAEGPRCLARLNREYDNLQAALEWSCKEESRHEIGLRMAAVLSFYWARRGHLREGRAWLERMLDRSSGAPAPVRAQALFAIGMIACQQRDYEHAKIRLEESVMLWRTTDDLVLSRLGRALRFLGFVHAMLGDLETAERLIEESIHLHRQAGSTWELALALFTRGTVAKRQKRLVESIEAHEESAAILRSIPDAWLLSWVLGSLATIAADQGQYDRAAVYWLESLTRLRSLVEYTLAVFATIRGIANLLCARGDYSLATRLYAAADAVQESERVEAYDSWDSASKRFVKRLYTTLGEAKYCALWAEGRRLTREQAIGLALAALNPSAARKTSKARERRSGKHKPRRGRVSRRGSSPLGVKR